jgi:hypothetical protein
MIKEIFELINYEMDFEVQKLELEKNEELIKSLRIQKHDFINHLQTIYGMIQLDKQEKAKVYIKSLSKDLSNLKLKKSSKDDSILASILLPKKLEATKVEIDFDFEIEEGVEDISISLNKLFKIISNLIDNAIDATKTFDGERKIRVIGENYGEKYVLSIYNSGPIIDEELKYSIFESGFSTKGTGRGFGLHIIKSIIENAQGELQLISEEEYGTEFTCYLPKKLR